jgi:hypothetical protein
MACIIETAIEELGYKPYELKLDISNEEEFKKEREGVELTMNVEWNAVIYTIQKDLIEYYFNRCKEQYRTIINIDFPDQCDATYVLFTRKVMVFGRKKITKKYVKGQVNLVMKNHPIPH